VRRSLQIVCATALAAGVFFALNWDLTPWGAAKAAQVTDTGCKSEVPSPPPRINTIPDYLKATPKWTAGTPGAKVRVDVYFPGLGHGSIQTAAQQLGKSFPTQVYVRYVDFQTQDGMEEWHRRGLGCGAILVNDRQEFELKTPNGTRKILFHGPPGETEDNKWRIADLHQVVAQEVKEAYGTSESGK